MQNMNIFYPHFLRLLLLASFLLGALAEEATECLNNNISPNDEVLYPEVYDDSTVMAEFLRKLETYTGFNSTERLSVTLNKCGGQECRVNPNGTAIWDARMDLYLSNMMNGTNKKTTLDGCLCYSENLTDYRSCMTDVRKNMINQLDTTFIEKFRTIVESDCTTFTVNCIP